MPSTSYAKPNGNHLEPLTWQQTTLSPAPPSTATRTTAPERTRSVKQPNKPSKANGKIGTRPHLIGSVSDSATLPSTGSTLNWQQELFQSTANSTTSFDQALESSSKRHQSPTKSSTTSSHPHTNSNPNQSRKQQVKDEETFGIANSPPTASPRPRTSAPGDRQTKSSKTSLKSPKPSRTSSNSLLPPSTPTSQSTSNSGTTTPRGTTTSIGGAGEARYAGPTFHNSPAPSSLPMPSFLLKRQQRSDLTA